MFTVKYSPSHEQELPSPPHSPQSSIVADPPHVPAQSSVAEPKQVPAQSEG
jgi:hypothetical protein